MPTLKKVKVWAIPNNWFCDIFLTQLKRGWIRLWEGRVIQSFNSLGNFYPILVKNISRSFRNQSESVGKKSNISDLTSDTTFSAVTVWWQLNDVTHKFVQFDGQRWLVSFEVNFGVKLGGAEEKTGRNFDFSFKRTLQLVVKVVHSICLGNRKEPWKNKSRKYIKYIF